MLLYVAQRVPKLDRFVHSVHMYSLQFVYKDDILNLYWVVNEIIPKRIGADIPGLDHFGIMLLSIGP